MIRRVVERASSPRPQWYNLFTETSSAAPQEERGKIFLVVRCYKYAAPSGAPKGAFAVAH
jgi:hypothetical protein